MAYRVLINVISIPDSDDATEKKAPVTDARVTFIPKALIREDPEDEMVSSGLEPYWREDWQAETYTHDNNGYYVPDPDKITSANLVDADNPALDPIAGEWLLVVKNNDSTPVIQRITLELKGEVLRALAGWKSEDAFLTGSAGACAKTVAIVNYKSGAAIVDAENTLITVTLFPRKEVAFLAGDEYRNKGTRFIIFAENRLKAMYRDKTVNAGVRAGMFDGENGTRTLKVKGQKGWIVVSRKEPVLSATKPADGAVDERLSILHFYEYLDHLGWEAEGCLIEAGIFSHAYAKGPVLWNTYDNSDSFVDRDPLDLDGRSKDWQDPGAMKQFKDLAKAFTDTGILKVWGCNAAKMDRQRVIEANQRIKKGTDRDEFFTVTSGCESENTSLNIMKFRMWTTSCSSTLVNRVYCASAAEFINRPSWGAPWGCGSNFIEGVMTIVESSHVYTYLENEFGIDVAADRDTSNYFNYQCMLSQPSPPEPSWDRRRWFTTYEIEHRSGRANFDIYPVFNLPGNFRIMKNDPVASSMNLHTFGFEAADDMREPGMMGHLYIFTKTQPSVLRHYPQATTTLFLDIGASVDTAILVQENMEYYLYTRAKASAEWELYITALPVINQTRDSEDHLMDDPASDEDPITDGLLFVDEGFVW